MKQNVNPAIVIAVVVVLVGGLGFVIFKAITGTSDVKQVNMKAADPNKTFKPDPRLGLGGT
jgi:hypothetical protein